MIRLEVDRAVFFAVAVRAWQLAAGPVTMLLIASRFSPETQGYYYTLGNLVALQSFIELGLYSVLLNLASHEWSRLGWDASRGEITGDATALSRLRRLDAFARRWYAVAAVAFTAVVGAIGAALLGRKPEAGVAWFWPWWGLVLISGTSFLLLPAVTLLEGCGRITTVNRYRFAQAVFGNLVAWTLILAGAGLWTVVAVVAVRLVGEVVLVKARFGRFFASLRAAPRAEVDPRHDLDWRRDVWPLQWRVAAQGLFMAASGAVFVPIVFHYHGPAEAGRLGMTWNILVVLQAAALAWVQTRIPLFGGLIAGRQFAELDRVWNRVTAVSLALLTAACAAFVAATAVLYAAPTARWHAPFSLERWPPLLADRLLPPAATAAFAAAIVLWHVPVSQLTYLRAHRIDPLVWINAAGNILIALAAWQLGRRYGSLGIGLGYLAVVALIFAPGFYVVWRTFRQGRDEDVVSGPAP